MAENNGICLIGVMDRLWFQHIILLQDHHHSSCVSEADNLKNNSSMEMSEESESESLFVYSSTNNSQTTLLLASSEDDDDEIISSAEDAIIVPTPLSTQDDDHINNNENINKKKTTTSKERPTRSLTTTTTFLSNNNKTIRSHSSSPSTQKKRSKIFHHSPGKTLLQKTMSCRSLYELEAEELKGFIDLGFTFDKQNLNKRIISVIPGLQRLESDDNNAVKIEVKEEVDQECDDNEEEEREKGFSSCGGYQRSGSVNCVPTSWSSRSREMTMRPYLSEAWLIKRPDSPLLNMRVLPRATAAADMKKHLKYWARTVASVIHQES